MAELQTAEKPILTSVAEIRYLTPENAEFSRTSGGFVALTVGEEKYERVGIFRSFPLDYPEEYLSVRDTERKEIGIIQRLSDFDEYVTALCRMELSRRYFIPVVHQILSFKERYGSAHIELKTNIGDIKIVVVDLGYNISGMENSGYVFITDASGNRYFVPNIEELDRKSQKYLEVYM